MITKHRILSLILLIFVILLSACSGRTKPEAEKVYITVNDESLSKEYISYFFYVAEIGMLSEAGYTSENSTQEDIATYWKTTEIDGKNAVDVARDLAADNAVLQKLQYQKALSEGISLSAQESADIDKEVISTSESNGGYEEFEKTLSDMGTDMASYKQIITENLYIQKLYEKYDAAGALTVSDEAIAELRGQYADDVTDEEIIDILKKQEFNKIVKQWKKEASIEIDDESIKEFNVN